MLPYHPKKQAHRTWPQLVRKKREKVSNLCARLDMEELIGITMRKNHFQQAHVCVSHISQMRQIIYCTPHTKFHQRQHHGYPLVFNPQTKNPNKLPPQHHHHLLLLLLLTLKQSTPICYYKPSQLPAFSSKSCTTEVSETRITVYISQAYQKHDLQTVRRRKWQREAREKRECSILLLHAQRRLNLYCRLHGLNLTLVENSGADLCYCG
jgi:hypothetical protein